MRLVKWAAYMVFDFKQKFLAKGFCVGGDSYIHALCQEGSQMMLWWGLGVHVHLKADS